MSREIGKQQDIFYMQHALTQARVALEQGEFPVGCVIAAEGELLAEGRRENSGGGAGETVDANEFDHAEILALRRLQRVLLARKKTIDCANITVYATLEPCLMCYSTLLVNGIRRIVYAYEDAMGGGTDLPLTALKPLYRDLCVEVVPGVLRRESLTLFQQFFIQQNNQYLQDSFLASYTLAQQ